MIAQSRVRAGTTLPSCKGCNFQLWLSLGGIALDPGDEASSLSIADMDVTNSGGLQESLHGAFNLIGRRAFTGDDPGRKAPDRPKLFCLSPAGDGN